MQPYLTTSITDIATTVANYKKQKPTMELIPIDIPCPICDQLTKLAKAISILCNITVSMEDVASIILTDAVKRKLETRIIKNKTKISPPKKR